MRALSDLDPLPGALVAELVERLLSPALLVDLDRVRRNVARVIEVIGGDPDRWRPHVKTSKLPAVFEVLAAAGVRHFKCATTREAACLLETLDGGGVIGDVLFGHPVVGPGLERLAAIAASHERARVSVLCEDPDAVGTIPPRLGVFVDLNPGMNRTGVSPEKIETVVEIAQAAGRRFGGVHFYEGHLSGRSPKERRREAFAGYDRLMALLEALERQAIDVPEVTTSGTPTFLDAREYRPLRERPGHRLSPGTVILHDTRSALEHPDLGLEPAALVFARVVSRPAPGIVTCDAGSKSIAAEAGDPCVCVVGHPELEALAPSEEHLSFRVTSGPGPARGTALLLVPRHVCPTVNLAEQAVLIDAGALAGIVPVAARAHETLFSPAPTPAPAASRPAAATRRPAVSR